MIVTYLGHQGWSFESEAGLVLLDPVFRTIGNAGVQLPIWPDREINPGALGPIASVVLSHEHSDHFDIDTLYRIPWRGEIHVSDRSSRSLMTVLSDMGYAVRRMRPFQVLSFAGLRLTVLPLEWSLLEPDSYGFLAQGDDGTSFFTSVDGAPHEQTIAWLQRNCPDRSVDNFTNNYLEPLPELTGVAGMDRYATSAMTAAMISGVGAACAQPRGAQRPGLELPAGVLRVQPSLLQRHPPAHGADPHADLSRDPVGGAGARYQDRSGERIIRRYQGTVRGAASRDRPGL